MGAIKGIASSAVMLSKLYTGLLVIAALFAMAALGMLMLVVIMHIGDLTIPTNNPAGMNH